MARAGTLHVAAGRSVARQGCAQQLTMRPPTLHASTTTFATARTPPAPAPVVRSEAHMQIVGGETGLRQQPARDTVGSGREGGSEGGGRRRAAAGALDAPCIVSIGAEGSDLAPTRNPLKGSPRPPDVTRCPSGPSHHRPRFDEASPREKRAGARTPWTGLTELTSRRRRRRNAGRGRSEGSRALHFLDACWRIVTYTVGTGY